MSSCSMVSSSFVHHIEPTLMGDDMLVAAAQDGHEWAFVELFTRNSKRVFNKIYGVTKIPDADDPAQEANPSGSVEGRDRRRGDLAGLANCGPGAGSRGALHGKGEVPA